jgi:hypothetical protein
LYEAGLQPEFIILGGKADPESVCNLCVILKFMLHNYVVSINETQHCLQLNLYTCTYEI